MSGSEFEGESSVVSNSDKLNYYGEKTCKLYSLELKLM